MLLFFKGFIQKISNEQLLTSNVTKIFQWIDRKRQNKKKYH